nr:dehydrogenase/reductase sdr family member 12 [Quercus suber]
MTSLLFISNQQEDNFPTSCSSSIFRGCLFDKTFTTSFPADPRFLFSTTYLSQMPGKTLLVLGSGPGIGVGVASTFAVRGFTHIALVARSSDKLKEDQGKVLDAIQERGYSCQVKTWACDLTDFERLNTVLGEVDGWGDLECVFFNAARVGGKPPLEESTEAIEKDFRLTNLAMYEVAKRVVPILQKKSEDASPSFIVTSTSQLYKEPLPELVSLSMVKSAQRALVFSLNAKFPEVHFALLSVGGVVSPDAKNLNPENIAHRCWELYKQPRQNWKREEEIHE